MIYANGLTKRYGSFRALDDVSFEVRKGEVVGFLGPNGAGKSTTMRILTCFISPTGGAAKVRGHDVFDDTLAVRSCLGYLPQRAPLYLEMTVFEYLEFAAKIRNFDKSKFKQRARSVVEICGLAQSLSKEIRHLSHGYRQRVGLAQALIHDPPILILDEPTSDLDPNERTEFLNYLKQIGKDRTILLSTHNLSEVEAACARAIIVSKGRVVADGPLDEIRAKSGKVRYVVTIHEKRVFEGEGRSGDKARKAPSAQEVQEALQGLPGVTLVSELPTDDRAHSFQLMGALGGDIRPEIFQLIVQKGWLLLELRRDSQTLEDVFKTLTKGDERKDRGRKFVDDDDDDDDKSARTRAAVSAGEETGDDDDGRDEDDRERREDDAEDEDAAADRDDDEDDRTHDEDEPSDDEDEPSDEDEDEDEDEDRAGDDDDAD